MPAVLTSDPIMSLQTAKEVGNVNDEQTAINLINIVSRKFLVYTNRVAINETSISEFVDSLDGNACFAHATPIVAGEVTVVEHYRDGSTAVTYTETGNDLIVDRDWGRIIKSGGCWKNRQGFRNLQISYTGGWATVPDGVVAGALAQMKVEQDRLKGSVGYDAITTAGDTVTPDRNSIVDEAKKAWDSYRVMA